MLIAIEKDIAVKIKQRKLLIKLQNPLLK